MTKVKHTELEIATAMKLKKSGMTIREISNRLNVPYGTVYEWVGNQKNRETGSSNADRHLCKSCKFRMGIHEKKELGGNCNYIEIVGVSRRCDVEKCDKYIRGRRFKKQRVFINFERIKENEQEKHESCTC